MLKNYKFRPFVDCSHLFWFFPRPSSWALLLLLNFVLIRGYYVSTPVKIFHIIASFFQPTMKIAIYQALKCQQGEINNIEEIWQNTSYRLRVTSCELRVTSWKLKCTSWELKSTSKNSKFKSTSYEFKSTSYEFNFMSYEFKSTSCEFKSTSYEFKITSYEFKITSYQFKFTSYEFKSTSLRIIKSMKTQVNSLQIFTRN